MLIKELKKKLQIYFIEISYIINFKTYKRFYYSLYLQCNKLLSRDSKKPLNIFLKLFLYDKFLKTQTTKMYPKICFF